MNNKGTQNDFTYEEIDERAIAKHWSFPVEFDQPHEVIRASAGSGKTYQLSNRYLGLLRNEIEPEQILATTFTRKAAGEILERILMRLANAARDDHVAAELAAGLADETLDRPAARDMLARLCGALHRVSVSTIDSFFNRVAQVFRFELRIPPDPVIAGQDDPMVAQLRARAIEAMLGDEEATTLVQLLRRLHHDNSVRSVTAAIDEIVSGLYDTYRASAPAAWQTLDKGELLDTDALTAAVDTLVQLAEQQTQKRLQKALAASVLALHQRDWKDFLSKGPAAKIVECPDAPLFYSKPLPDAVEAAYRPLVAHAGGAMLQAIRDRTHAMFDLTARFDAHFTRLREAHHVLLYADLPHRLLQFMGTSETSGEQWNRDLHYRLDTRVSHLLLDEFQDTSFDQWAVLKPFADEITAMANQSRSFFCVGDVKQAIYGWRGGRAEIFDRLQSDLQLEDDAVRQLNENYRSSQVVLDAVNQVFDSLTDNAALTDDVLYEQEAENWQHLFEPHVAVRDQPGYVELATTGAIAEEDDNGAGDGADLDFDGDEELGAATSTATSTHIEQVADRVKQMHEAHPHATLGVLVSTNQTVRELLFQLGSRGVNVSGEGGVAIAGDPAINLIMAALKLAEHPGDEVAAFSLFNSPMRDTLPLPSRRAADCERTAQHIRRSLQSAGYASTMATWCKPLAADCDEHSARRLTQLIDLADRFDPGVSLRVRDFVDYIEGAAVEEPSAASVRVMTIHKAKGLEFDIVVLPELNKEIGRISTQAVLVNQDDQTSLIQEIHAYASADIRAMSQQLTDAYEQEKARRIREGLCVLYVAMTRARHALHMLLKPVKEKARGGLAAEGRTDHSFAATLRAALLPDDFEETTDGGQTLFTHGDPDWASSIETAETAPAEQIALPQFEIAADSDIAKRDLASVSPSSLHAAHRALADRIVVQPAMGMLRGSLIHKWFEQIEWLEHGETLPQINWLHIGRQVVPPTMASDAWLSDQLEQFKQMLHQPQVRATLERPSESTDETLTLWRERPFAVKLDDQLLNGVFDRVEIHRQSSEITRVSIIDFKTDEITETDTIDAAAERYRLQMKAYVDAACKLLNIDQTIIQASLLFVGVGERCDLQWDA